MLRLIALCLLSYTVSDTFAMCSMLSTNLDEARIQLARAAVENDFDYARIYANRAQGALDDLAAARGLGDGRGAVEAAERGDSDAIECLRIVGERLGLAIANALNTFDPELVVIGGGVSTAGEFLLRPARQVAQEFTMRGLGTKTEIRIARYGVHAGVRGAAMLALTEEAAAG